MSKAMTNETGLKGIEGEALKMLADGIASGELAIVWCHPDGKFPAIDATDDQRRIIEKALCAAEAMRCDVCNGEGRVAYIQSDGGFSEPSACYKCSGSGKLAAVPPPANEVELRELADKDQLFEQIYAVAQAWKGANGGIYCIRGMCLELLEKALLPRLAASQPAAPGGEDLLKHCGELHDLGFHAGWNGAIEEAEKAFEFIRLKLIYCLKEPERSAFWKAIEMRDAIRSLASKPLSGAVDDGMCRHGTNLSRRCSQCEEGAP